MVCFIVAAVALVPQRVCGIKIGWSLPFETVPDAEWMSDVWVIPYEDAEAQSQIELHHNIKLTAWPRVVVFFFMHKCVQERGEYVGNVKKIDRESVGEIDIEVMTFSGKVHCEWQFNRTVWKYNKETVVVAPPSTCFFSNTMSGSNPEVPPSSVRRTKMAAPVGNSLDFTTSINEIVNEKFSEKHVHVLQSFTTALRAQEYRCDQPCVLSWKRKSCVLSL